MAWPGWRSLCENRAGLPSSAVHNESEPVAPKLQPTWRTSPGEVTLAEIEP